MTSDPAADPRDVVRRLYAAFGARDVAALGAIFADDVVWQVPGATQLAGDHRGKDGVLAYLGKLRELSNGTFKATVTDVLGGDGHGAAIATVSAERNGARYDGAYCLLCTVTGGRIVRARLLNFDQAAFDAFWA